MFRITTLCALLLAAPIAAEADTARDPVVARVNGTVISESEFLRALSQATAVGATDTPELRTLVKSQLVARELFKQEAAKQKLEKDPKVQEAVSEARDNAMVQRYLQQSVKPKTVTEEQLRQQYETIKAGLGDIEYKPRIMLLQDQATAKAVLAQLRSGGQFDALARLYSSAPSAARGGELDWVSFKSPPVEGQTQGIPLPVAQLMVKLKKGALAADPIEANGRYYIVQMDDARPTSIPDYESVKPTLRRMLEARALQQAAEALVKDLLAKARIE